MGVICFEKKLRIVFDKIEVQMHGSTDAAKSLKKYEAITLHYFLIYSYIVK